MLVVSGVKSSQDALVFVMGATNRPEKLDEAVSGTGDGFGRDGWMGWVGVLGRVIVWELSE